MIGVTHQYPYIINILCVIAQASLRFGSGLARAGKCLQPCTNYQCFTRSARLRAGGPIKHFTPGRLRFADRRSRHPRKPGDELARLFKEQAPNSRPCWSPAGTSKRTTRADD